VSVGFWRVWVLGCAVVEESIESGLGSYRVVELTLSVGAYLVLHSFCGWFPCLEGFLGVSSVYRCPGVISWS
jgi:hypothetical protein